MCHAPLDEAVANAICVFLENEKISCWLASHELATREDTVAMTDAAIDDSPGGLIPRLRAIRSRWLSSGIIPPKNPPNSLRPNLSFCNGSKGDSVTASGRFSQLSAY
jgi:hypothetical protein